MFTLVKYVYEKSQGWISKDPKAIPYSDDDNIDSLCSKMQEIVIEYKNLKDDEVQENLQEEKVGCFEKRGQVTHVEPHYILIEGKFQVDRNKAPSNIKVGDVVDYVAYKESEYDEEKVHRIKVADMRYEHWDLDPNDGNTEWERDSVNNEFLERKNIEMRHIPTQITRRQERLFFTDQENLSFHLSKVKINFIPCIGDYVICECLVATDEERLYQIEHCLEVKKVRASNFRINIGDITFYNEATGHGSIDRTILFVKDVCQKGYIPKAKDVVVYECIESKQNSFNYRALQVAPISDAKKKNISDVNVDDLALSQHVETREHLEVTGETVITLESNTTKQFEIVIKYVGIEGTKHLRKCLTLTKPELSQIDLLNPSKNDQTVLKPGDSIIYSFECTGKNIGLSKETIVFRFNGFEIKRSIGRYLHEYLDLLNPKISLKSMMFAPIFYYLASKSQIHSKL